MMARWSFDCWGGVRVSVGGGHNGSSSGVESFEKYTQPYCGSREQTSLISKTYCIGSEIRARRFESC